MGIPLPGHHPGIDAVNILKNGVIAEISARQPADLAQILLDGRQIHFHIMHAFDDFFV